jgi:hypothetical protein
VLGYFVIPAIYPFYYVNFSGAFTPWRLLSGPRIISHIVGTEKMEYPSNTSIYLLPLGGFDLGQFLTPKYYDGLLVKTDDGKYFSYFSDTKNTEEMCDRDERLCETLREVDPSSVADWSLSSIEKDCSFDNLVYEFDPLPPRLPRAAKPIECIVYRQYRYDSDGGESWIYYTLLDSGELWRWKFEHEKHNPMLIKFSGIILGVLAGILISVIILWLNRERAQLEDLKWKEYSSKKE